MTNFKIKNKLLIISLVSIILGVICLVIKAFSVEYIDAEGFLHESFFLLPIGFFFILVGIILFTIIFVKKIIQKFKNN